MKQSAEENTQFMSFSTQKRKEIGRTEALPTDSELWFHNSVELNYTFEDTQNLYIQVWKQKDQENVFTDSQRQLWGEQWISVGQLLVRFGCIALLPLALGELTASKQEPMVEITAVEPKHVKSVVSLHLAAAKLRKPSGIFGSIRPILILRRSYQHELAIDSSKNASPYGDETLWEVVYETEPVKEENIFHSLTRNTALQRNMFDFGRLDLFQEDLNRGNVDLPLSFEVIHLKKTGQRSPIGTFLTSQKFLSDQQPNSIFPLESAHRDHPSPPGYIVLLSPIRTHTLRTFLDYIVGGCELRMILGIDFTASNGNPRQPGTLHYCGDASRKNEYERAIREIANILLAYQVEQEIACYGFGAKLPPHEKTHHCFPLTLDERNPYFRGLEDVIAGYHSMLRSIEFHGPTVLAQVIKTATNMAIEQLQVAANARYFVLFILTDGAISDIHATTEEIIRASQSAPLSIVLIGIGSDDFKDMDSLTSCYQLERPILQFVPYRQFSNSGGSFSNLAMRKVLAEIPQQMLAFMKLAQIKPKRPMRRSLNLYPQIVQASAPLATTTSSSP
ncbi:uncharacterized protein Gasu_52670 [Galdieria sulphuraria]|uniref:VWFA domain-containing protein n=1 Tax=Galdieria sulphuraria TaxID=130081 RepID=M2WTE0_GALSU|nr:uncharacterized protein Gasu_52670 [Galdieria sulphuraria]EME27165.1 hypothetical protein Gasu_52670 [Galdieria sulphuraria]|eukprot:XP_005703685.1 hypothetical protein Gasu_52670 [Galdieria sulphuraria]